MQLVWMPMVGHEMSALALVGGHLIFLPAHADAQTSAPSGQTKVLVERHGYGTGRLAGLIA